MTRLFWILYFVVAGSMMTVIIEQGNAWCVLAGCLLGILSFGAGGLALGKQA